MFSYILFNLPKNVLTNVSYNNHYQNENTYQ